MIIDELKEGLGNDVAALTLLKACEPAIMSWTYLYNIYVNMQEAVEGKCGYGELFQGLEESYCDIMALYDVLLKEPNCELTDVFCAIDSIIQLLTIQEANHIMEQMLKFVRGEVKEIRSLHLRRLQFFVIGIMSEVLVLDNPKLKKELIQVDWSDASKSFMVNHSDVHDANKALSFDVLHRFSDMPNFNEKVKVYFEGTMESLDIMHEYYYKSVIYTFFHAYQDGFITKDFKGLYLKSKSDASDDILTGRVDMAAITNAVTHDDMVKNITEVIAKEKEKNPNMKVREMNAMLHLMNADKIQEVYAEMHDNRMITGEESYKLL